MTTSNADSGAERRARSSEEGKARTFLRVAATTAAAGILLASAGDESVARWLTIVGLVLLVVGLHRFGRLGADPPLDLEAGPKG